MAEFKELQQLWQRQQPQCPTPLGEAAALKNAFRRYGRRNDLIYLGKAIVIASLLIFLLSLLRHRPLAAFGASLAVFSGVVFLISDWRTQRAIARLNFASPSVEFLRSAIARLEAQRDPFHTREFRIAWGGLWIGCTVMIADQWFLMTPFLALAVLACVIAAQFAAYASARRVRGKRFEKQCRPLIHRLESLLKIMEDDRV
jgi:putative flippase GtrA